MNSLDLDYLRKLWADRIVSMAILSLEKVSIDTQKKVLADNIPLSIYLDKYLDLLESYTSKGAVNLGSGELLAKPELITSFVEKAFDDIKDKQTVSEAIQIAIKELKNVQHR